MAVYQKIPKYSDKYEDLLTLLKIDEFRVLENKTRRWLYEIPFHLAGAFLGILSLYLKMDKFQGFLWCKFAHIFPIRSILPSLPPIFLIENTLSHDSNQNRLTRSNRAD